MSGSPSHLLRLVLLACGVAAVFGAEPLATWVDGSIAAGTIVQTAADSWYAAMQQIGLDQPYDAVRNMIRALGGN